MILNWRKSIQQLIVYWISLLVSRVSETRTINRVDQANKQCIDVYIGLFLKIIFGKQHRKKINVNDYESELGRMLTNSP